MEHTRHRLDGAHLLRLSSHLTDRDHRILSLLSTHRVLTTPQIAQAAFTSNSRAVQRLRALTGLGLVARFRPRRDRGSAPWHYVLDTSGAHVLAADEGRDVDRVRVRRDRQLALAHSTHLAHRVGANGFFTALVWAARTNEDMHLREWLNPSDAYGLVEDRHSAPWDGGLPRPDGYGLWREEGRSVAFFLEWDTGTETHRQLTTKIERYVDLCDNALAPLPGVLFVFPTPRRENNVRAVLRRVQNTRRLAVATTHMPAARTPHEAVWAPLNSPMVQGRVRLVDAAAPDVGEGELF
ncbi:replication-relaxation family protein [Nocardiopsis alba]|uniref:replication-relaxation family protein n=1 Tax=Nocardiopsis alba TaxID=53437 RepID=UPI0036B02F64